MGEVEVMTCLLCSGKLPRGDLDVVEQHLQEQHRVYSNLTLVVGASKLGVVQLQVMEKMVQDMGREVTSKQLKESKEEEIVLENIKKDFEELEAELDTDDFKEEPKLEPESESEEEEYTPTKAKNSCNKQCRHNNCKHKRIICNSKNKVYNENEEEELTPTKSKRPYKRIIDRESIMSKVDQSIANSGYTPEKGPCVCPICKLNFDVKDDNSEKLYRKHIYHHRVVKWNCACALAFEKHKWNHPKKFHIYSVHRGLHHCITCLEAFNDEEIYNNHLKQHTAEGPLQFICDDCGFTSKNKYFMSNHKAYMHDTKISICDICFEEFPGRLKMKMHRRRAHINAGPKQCPHCGHSFKQLWGHIKLMHTDDKDKKYSCEYCKRGFVEKCKMEAHIRSAHTGEKPFQCRWGCGHGCAEAGNRKKHEITRLVTIAVLDYVCFVPRIKMIMFQAWETVGRRCDARR